MTALDEGEEPSQEVLLVENIVGIFNFLVGI